MIVFILFAIMSERELSVQRGTDDDVEDVQTQMMAVIGENNNFHRTIMVIVIVVSSAPLVPNNNNPYTSEEQRRDIVRNRRSFVQYIMAPTIPISRVEHAY